MKYIEGIDYWVRYREFPCTTIFAWAVSLGDGTFDIWLNTRVSEEKQLEGLHHDLKHLEDNHFYRDDLTLAQKEAIAWGVTGFVEPETTESEKPLEEVEPYCAHKPPPLDNNVQPVQIGADSEIMIPVFSDVLAAVRWLEKKKTCTAKKPYKPIDKRKLDIYMEIK